MSEFVGATHDFHDVEYARRWADGFSPSPARLQLFDTIIGALKANQCQQGHIVELGSGPGYLAEHILTALPEASYECVDFSHAMLNIARSALLKFSNRVRFTQADLTRENWQSALRGPVDAVVSTWALHDLGSDAHIAAVYRASKAALRTGGILLNGDFIKPEGASCPFEAGRLTIARHLELLNASGFEDVKCLAILETELVQPNAAQNYACLRALA